MSYPRSFPGMDPGDPDCDLSDDLKVLLIGEDDSGRLTLARALSTGRTIVDGYPDPFPTYRSRVEAPDGRYVPFHVRVLPTEPPYHRSLSYEYTDTKVALLCFAVDDPESFEAIPRRWLPEMRKHLPTEVPVVLVGTKADVAKRRVTEVQGRSAVELVGARAYFECSSYSGVQLKELMSAVAEFLVQEYERLRAEYFLNDSP